MEEEISGNKLLSLEVEIIIVFGIMDSCLNKNNEKVDTQ